MMLIEELWYGNINPQAKTYTHRAKYSEAMQAQIRNEKNLIESLTESQKEIFEKYQECQDILIQYDTEDAFVAGFRLGTKLLAESFCEDDGFFKNITD